ncbi:MAG: hypothetical protein H6585_12915 [Flavobacteriales bacterium]|nr:hypothetical protein [Flavobacteriales bacterium]MCB9449233.1 hypothetical protein [Flavobacteriales bacterium]
MATGMSVAQQRFNYLGRSNNLVLEPVLQDPSTDFHTGFHPYVQTFLNKAVNVDSVAADAISYRTKQAGDVGGFMRKIRYESLIKVDTTDFQLTIDPLMDFHGGRQRETDSVVYFNTRGFAVHGRIGNRVTFYSDFRENQARVPDYLDEYIKSAGVVPGHGAVKDFKGTGFDYAMASGYVSLDAGKYFNLQFGHGKHFIGDGYRSLLLSDAAFNYPYLRITTQIWKIQYTNLFASFQNIDDQNGTFAPHSYEGGYRKKFSSFHYLSWNVCQRLQLGFFEGILWQASDSTWNRGFDINYLNPIIFFRPVEFSLGSPDNAILGLNLKYKVAKGWVLYGQGVIDDLNISRKKDLQSGGSTSGFIQNKQGYQLGFHAYHLLGVRNLHLQGEWNQVRPYTYGHKTPQQSYTHFGEPLAHPLGANFREQLVIANYRWHDLGVECRFVTSVYGADSTSAQHYGHDIFKSDFDAQRGLLSFGNTLLQGERTRVNNLRLTLSYLVNPTTNLNVFVGWFSRNLKNDTETRSASLFIFGLHTDLDNFYDDF